MKNNKIKKSKVVLDTCVNLGHARLDGYNISTYCVLCSKGIADDDTHQNLDCKNCPDFEAYSYECEYV